MMVIVTFLGNQNRDAIKLSGVVGGGGGILLKFNWNGRNSPSFATFRWIDVVNFLWQDTTVIVIRAIDMIERKSGGGGE